MQRELFYPTVEGEARLLLLISGFSVDGDALEGRTKLAKLDFLLRYPTFFARALGVRRQTRATTTAIAEAKAEGENIETRMVRYRYGPWDPAYFAILGRLIGKGLVVVVQTPKGIAYRASSDGTAVAAKLASEPAWRSVATRVGLLKRHFDQSGSSLKTFIYEHFPEVTKATWGDAL